MSEKAILTIEDRIATLRFNRPEMRHALDTESYQALAKCLDEVAQNDQIQALILTGSQDFFTAGNDLHDFLGPLPTDGEFFEGLKFLSALRRVPVPIIAAVEGMAVGIGCTLLLHCEFVIAAENTIFTMPFAPLGACPEGGSSDLLPKAVGMRKAQEWLLLGSKITAQEALQTQLITRTCSPGDTLNQAQQLAKQLCKLPRYSLIATKALLRQHQGFDEQACFSAEQKRFIECITQPSSKAIIQAFLNKG